MSVIWNWLVAVFAPLTWLLRLVWRPLVWFFGILVGLMLIGVAAYGLWTAIGWGWSFASNLGASSTQVVEPTIVVIVPTMTPIPVATETLEPTATAEPTSVVKAAKDKPAKTKPAAGQKVVQQPTVVVVQQPTLVPTGVPIVEGAPNQCGYTLPADWLEVSDVMTQVGQTRILHLQIPAGKVGFVWGTTVTVGTTSLTRGLVLVKGPYVGDFLVLDGAGRVGFLTDMSDVGLAKALSHVEAWLRCSYGPDNWQPSMWVPANQ